MDKLYAVVILYQLGATINTLLVWEAAPDEETAFHRAVKDTKARRPEVFSQNWKYDVFEAPGVPPGVVKRKEG